MKKLNLFSVYVVFLILSNGIFLDALAQIPPIERAALIDLYSNSDGDHWEDNSGWKALPLDVDGFAISGTEGSWYGVTVVIDTVTEIDHHSNNLTGDIPSSISDLLNLTSLNLGENQLISIPPEIGNLASLTTLNLEWNQLTSIPPEIGNLSRLTNL